MVEPAPCSGIWNMAVDEALLEAMLAADPHDTACIVRVYAWETATVSLGYFQDAKLFLESGPQRDLPAVRRLSGGGAILHDREITYSCAVASRHPAAREPSRIYRIVHEALIGVLTACGIRPVFRDSALNVTSEPFLCFLRGDPNDLVFRGNKIAGSAQRRRRGAVLQHGSLILDTSPHAAEIPGIVPLSDGLELPDKLPEQIGEAIATRLSQGRPIERMESWPESLAARAQELAGQRYSHLDWRQHASGQAAAGM